MTDEVVKGEFGFGAGEAKQCRWIQSAEANDPNALPGRHRGAARRFLNAAAARSLAAGVYTLLCKLNVNPFIYLPQSSRTPLTAAFWQ